MSGFTEYLKLGSVLVAAFLLGNWYLAEVKKAKIAAKPWYAPYLTIPGVIMITFLILLPIYAIFIKR